MLGLDGSEDGLLSFGHVSGDAFAADADEFIEDPIHDHHGIGVVVEGLSEESGGVDHVGKAVVGNLSPVLIL